MEAPPLVSRQLIPNDSFDILSLSIRDCSISAQYPNHFHIGESKQDRWAIVHNRVIVIVRGYYVVVHLLVSSSIRKPNREWRAITYSLPCQSIDDIEKHIVPSIPYIHRPISPSAICSSNTFQKQLKQDQVVSVDFVPSA